MVKNLITYPKGAVLQIKNSVNPGYIYIIKSGEVGVKDSLQPYGKGVSFKYQPGDTFGLVSAMTGHPHIDTLVAETEVTAVRLNIESFLEYLNQNRDILLKMITHGSQRMRFFVEAIGSDKVIRSKKDSFEKLYYHARSYINIGRPDMAFFAINKFISAAKQSPKGVRHLQDAEELLSRLSRSQSMPEHTKTSGKATLNFSAGDIIFLENEPNDYFYFVVKGSVRISKLLNESEIILGVIEEDDIFGEMAIIENKVRTASAVAYTECTIMRLPADLLLHGTDNFILNKLLVSYSRRLWYASQRHHILKLGDAQFKVYNQIWIMAKDKLSKKKDAEPTGKCELFVSLDDVKKMVGLHVSNSDISEVNRDSNLSIQRNSIIVRDIHSLDAKIKALRHRYI
jgi:CRP/FNR family transcriptional regulator, cyclic AMP receptor protein